MKKCFIVFFIFILMLSSCSRQHSTSNEESIDTKVRDGSAVYRLILKVPVGIGVERLSYNRFYKKGPVSFTISDDGTITIFETIRTRLVEFKDNKYVRSISLQDCHLFNTMFSMDDEQYYIFAQYSKNGMIHIIDKENGLIIENKEIKYDDNHFDSIIAEDGGLQFVTYNHKRFILDNDKIVPDGKYLEITDDKEVLTVKSDNAEWKLKKEGNSEFRDGYNILNADKDNFLYVLKNNTIYKYNTNGDVVGFVKDNKPYKRIITNNGDIYEMYCDFETVRIYELILGNSD